MEINLNANNLEPLSCSRCKKASKTVNKSELYCSLRMEIISSERVACKHIDAKPPEKPLPPKANELKSPESKTVEVDGIWIWIGNRELIGKIIGREGRNIQCLEQISTTTIEIHDLWAWVGSELKSRERIVAAMLFSLTKCPDTSWHPAIIQETFVMLEKQLIKLSWDSFWNRVKEKTESILDGENEKWTQKSQTSSSDGNNS